jgi:aldose 1-epimerase
MKKAVASIAFLMLAATPSFAASITARDWGTTAKGETVRLFTLKGEKGLEAHITNYGGVIVDLLVPGKGGKAVDVMLGYDDFKSYERGGVYGAIIGRYVGRIKDGKFPFEGRTVQLTKANPNAKFVIHGGTAGFQKKLWHAEMVDGREPSLILTVSSPDGDGGYPGHLVTTVTYTVTRNNELKLDYSAAATGPSIANLTNHAYFALQGEGNGNIDKQTLQVFADRFLPQDADNLVTGEIASVEGTPFDFRKPVALAGPMASSHPQVAMRGGLDIAMLINGKPGTLRPAAKLTDPSTGIVMEVLTTQPAMQLYSDNIGNRTSPGKGGKPYGNHFSMSLETEGYLDAVNHPEWPSTEVRPGKPLHEVTVFRFGRLR